MTSQQGKEKEPPLGLPFCFVSGGYSVLIGTPFIVDSSNPHHKQIIFLTSHPRYSALK
jgi:hypothetical protein